MTGGLFVRIFHAALIAVILAWSSAAMADDLDHDQRLAKMRAIALQVVSNNGTVDRKVHDRFWALLPPKLARDAKLPAVRAALERRLAPIIRTATRFETEVWTSAKLSADAHRIIRTPGLAPAERASLAAALPSGRSAVRLSIKHADDILVAAANGTPVKTPFGPRMVTAAAAEQTLGRIATTMARVKRLLDPVWTGA